MDIAILGSDEGDGSDMGGITGGVRGVAGGAKDTTSGIGSVGVGTLMSSGISTGYGSSGCSRCGISGCSAPVGAPGSAPYVVILVHLSRVNISQQMRLHSS